MEFYLNFYIYFCAFYHFDIDYKKHYHKKQELYLIEMEQII